MKTDHSKKKVNMRKSCTACIPQIQVKDVKKTLYYRKRSKSKKKQKKHKKQNKKKINKKNELEWILW